MIASAVAAHSSIVSHISSRPGAVRLLVQLLCAALCDAPPRALFPAFRRALSALTTIAQHNKEAVLPHLPEVLQIAAAAPALDMRPLILALQGY